MFQIICTDYGCHCGFFLQISAGRDTDVFKTSPGRLKKVTTSYDKPDVFTMSGRRPQIYVVLKMSDLRRHEDIWFTTSWRCPIYDVLETSDLLRLWKNVVATSTQHQKKYFFLIYTVWNIQEILSISV